jgi:hypothetical protein
MHLDSEYGISFEIEGPNGHKAAIGGDAIVATESPDETSIDTYLVLTGTASFELLNDAKVTFNFVPVPGTDGYTIDSVVLTQGEQSLAIGDFTPYPGTDYRIVKGMNGLELDRSVPDGRITWTQSRDGTWLDSDGRPVQRFVWDGMPDETVGPEPSGPSFCQMAKIASRCIPSGTYCFTWLEAMAAAFGNVLVKQVDKMNYIYKNLNACYAISANKECSDEVYKDFCKAREAMGGTGDPAGWTSRVVDGKTLWTPSQAAAEEAGKGQVFWQQVLTGAAQQFQLSAQTGMTVQNAVSQGLQTVSRGS